MSTIKVNSIKNTATNDGGIAIDNSGHVQIDGQQLPSAGPLSNRNLIDNGGMSVAQRGTSESGLTDSPAFVVDRFSYRRVGAWGTNSFTMSQESSGAPGGFTHFLRLTQSGTAAAPPADTDCRLNTRLEGLNTAQAGFGTSAAKDLTLSFYAKGSIAGTYCLVLQNDGADQSYIAEYSLTTSWTRYEITIPARTTGTWLTSNGRGLELSWTIAADSDSTVLVGSAGWNTSNARITSNQSETFASTSGATFDLCGVQLEIGKKATPFEHRSYADELFRCQRYYQEIVCGRVNLAWHGVATDDGRVAVTMPLPREPRLNIGHDISGSTLTRTGVIRVRTGFPSSSANNVDAIDFYGNYSDGITIGLSTTDTSVTANNPYIVRMGSATNEVIFTLDTEL